MGKADQVLESIPEADALAFEGDFVLLVGRSNPCGQCLLEGSLVNGDVHGNGRQRGLRHCRRRGRCRGCFLSRFLLSRFPSMGK